MPALPPRRLRPRPQADDRRGPRRRRGAARRRGRASLGRRLAHGRHQHRTRADAGGGRGAADRRPRPDRGRALLRQGGRRRRARRGRPDRPPRQDAEPAGLLLAQLHLGNGGRARRRLAQRDPVLRPGAGRRGRPDPRRLRRPLAARGAERRRARRRPAWCRSRRARDGRGRPRSAPAEAREKLADAVGAALAGPRQPPPSRTYPAELRVAVSGEEIARTTVANSDELLARSPRSSGRAGSRASTASSPPCCPPATTRA